MLGNELQTSAFVSDLLHSPACGTCRTPWLRRACSGQMTDQDSVCVCVIFHLRQTCEIWLKTRMKTLTSRAVEVWPGTVGGPRLCQADPGTQWRKRSAHHFASVFQVPHVA